MTAQHSSASNEHYTPVEVIEAARAVMGGIDLDPATTDSVNRLRVKAKYRYTKAENGLNLTWGTPDEPARVWLNPPGGKTGNRSNAAIWWARLVDQYLAGHVSQGIYLGFSIEILATSQDADIWAGTLPFCVPRQRIAFDTTPEDFQIQMRAKHDAARKKLEGDIFAHRVPVDADYDELFKKLDKARAADEAKAAKALADGAPVSGDSPTHQNVIVYLPPTDDYDASVVRFEEAFGKFGGVRL